MAYTAWNVTFGEVPTEAKWNQLGENDAGFKSGDYIDDDAILPEHLNGYETGNNANGHFTRFVDGRLVCWIKRLEVPRIASDRVEATWALPATFVDTDYSAVATFIGVTDGTLSTSFPNQATPSSEGLAGIGIGNIKIDSMQVGIRHVSGKPSFTSGDKLFVNVFAIGRWK